MLLISVTIGFDDEHLRCYTGNEVEADKYLIDVCDEYSDPLLNESCDTCYFFAKSNGKIKRSCIHHSLCPLGDGKMGCLELSNRISCCCNDASLCNDYTKIAKQCMQIFILY